MDVMPICMLHGACFARGEYKRCKILTKAYAKNCPFQKPECDVTKGVRYGYNPVTSKTKPKLGV